MTFGEILARIVDDTPGALTGTIVGRDGIPLDQYSRSPDAPDLAELTIEFQRAIDECHKVAGALTGEASGGLEELIVRTNRHQLVFRPIDPEYVLVVALEPTGSLGKARYLMRTVLQDLQQEL